MKLIPEELDALIQEYLTDGVLTEKERKVILKKAVGMGLDSDEIDLYLDAQIQKLDQASDAVIRKQKGKTCPYCGGSVHLLVDKCPHCGENITVQASEELQEIFDNLEEALVALKGGDDYKRNKATVERYVRKAKMYYGNNPKVQKLLAEVEDETAIAEKEAKVAGVKGAFTKNINSIGCFVSLLLMIVPIMILNIYGPDTADRFTFLIFLGAPLGFFFLIRGVVQSEQKDD